MHGNLLTSKYTDTFHIPEKRNSTAEQLNSKPGTVELDVEEMNMPRYK